ncbi:MAG: hypothetical protein A2X86_01420 [Bdellovibrionales bacterium GWA2_49_15]|nr:MAG: hypothetical protein A2X86_01420 [Bdellovibrionales bacterium GWA2_49_15]
MVLTNDITTSATPLTRKFPSLETIARTPILDGETPYHALKNLETYLTGKEHGRLWVKRDDLSSREVGGNKARKLEYLLAEAKRENASELITFGMWGSNHALATAIAGHALQLGVTLHLGPQPPTPDVRKKLLAMHALGAKLVFHGGQLSLGLGIAQGFLRSLWSKKIFYIPPGGSNALSTLGYVNAFLELQEQLEGKPLPKRIFLPMGTAGTSAGLLVGSCLAGVQDQVQIVSVGISHSPISNGKSVLSLARKTYNFIRKHLSKADLARLPVCDFKKNFTYLKEYSEPGYGATNPAVFLAMDLLQTQEGLVLDGTYSGKAFLAMRQTVEAEVKRGEEIPTTLFWLTYNGQRLEQIIHDFPWKNPAKPYLDLPQSFHFIFD